MSKPRQDFLDAFDLWPIGQGGAFDHDDGKPKLARSIDLGTSAGAAGIASDQIFDAAPAHQFAVVFKCERAARDDELGLGQRQRTVGCIDESQRIGMLRFGRKGREMLPADREKDARAFFRQSSDRCIDIGDFNPMVAGCASPRRALQRNQRNVRRGAGFDRVPAHLGGKRMRRIDHVRDALLANEIRKSRRAAKAADPRRQLMTERDLRAPRIGIDRVDLLGHASFSELVGVACSAQNEGAHV